MRKFLDKIADDIIESLRSSKRYNILELHQQTRLSLNDLSYLGIMIKSPKIVGAVKNYKSKHINREFLPIDKVSPMFF